MRHCAGRPTNHAPALCMNPPQVVRVESPTRIVGRALSGHTLQELALLHLPGAYKVRRRRVRGSQSGTRAASPPTRAARTPLLG
jgi:hypothetical protein